MVRHGAGQLLVELVATTDRQKDADVRKRASAAFRNLLCVSVSTESCFATKDRTLAYNISRLPGLAEYLYLFQ